jgi:hypothetical protein
MTPHSRLRRIGWLAALAVCTVLYLMLHLKVHAVRSEVVRAERQIVALEQEKLLLETEFETRASQRQLAAWNSVDFGYDAPTARQFLESERQLARFGRPRAPGAPEPIRVAGVTGNGEPEYPRMVSPLTGKPVDEALLKPEDAGQLASVRLGDGRMRIQLGAVMGSVAE